MANEIEIEWLVDDKKKHITYLIHKNKRLAKYNADKDELVIYEAKTSLILKSQDYLQAFLNYRYKSNEQDIRGMV